MNRDFSFTHYWQERTRWVNEALDRWLPSEDTPPAVLHRAMRYSLFAGGKRLRPLLVFMGYEMAGGTTPEEILPAACAIELIHTFSLIHDDLPAMDDDDLRRGKPTCHRVFGEAIAILAGDGLFSYAFRLLTQGPLPPERKVRIIETLTEATGSAGMIGGQVLDISCEGQQPTRERVLEIHRRKTAALIRASLVVGGIGAGLSEAGLQVYREAGEKMGIAFQIVDDLLDELGSPEEVGKGVKKDLARGKCTYPRAVGLEKAREDAARLLAEAKGAIGELVGTERARPFLALADFILSRTY